MKNTQDTANGPCQTRTFPFHADPTIPIQYFEIFRNHPRLDPERSLALAILEDAVSCFQRHVQSRNPKEREQHALAEQWFLAETADWVFSFENVCALLRLDAGYLRLGLLRWKDRVIESAAHAKVGKSAAGFARGSRSRKRFVAGRSPRA
jgi:hypothetical protein